MWRSGLALVLLVGLAAGCSSDLAPPDDSATELQSEAGHPLQDAAGDGEAVSAPDPALITLRALADLELPGPLRLQAQAFHESDFTFEQVFEGWETDCPEALEANRPVYELPQFLDVRAYFIADEEGDRPVQINVSQASEQSNPRARIDAWRALKEVEVACGPYSISRTLDPSFDPDDIPVLTVERFEVASTQGYRTTTTSSQGGATSIEVAVLDRHGQPLVVSVNSTVSDVDPAAVLNELFALARSGDADHASPGLSHRQIEARVGRLPGALFGVEHVPVPEADGDLSLYAANSDGTYVDGALSTDGTGIYQLFSDRNREGERLPLSDLALHDPWALTADIEVPAFSDGEFVGVVGDWLVDLFHSGDEGDVHAYCEGWRSTVEDASPAGDSLSFELDVAVESVEAAIFRRDIQQGETLYEGQDRVWTTASACVTTAPYAFTVTVGTPFGSDSAVQWLQSNVADVLAAVDHRTTDTASA